MSLISITGLTFSYEGSYDNIFEDVSLRIDTDWRLGLIGRNGRGKTTLLNLLMGKFEYVGTIKATCSFEYFPYQVEDECKISGDIIKSICPNYEEWELVREINLLETDESILQRRFNTLSNGERTKLLLAALFLRENSFLLIDEPTNHLDISARKAVGKYLRTKSGFILVSHDRALLNSCVDHVLSINKTDIELQRGNFSSWWENMQKKEAFERSENERLKKDISRLKSAAAKTSSWSQSVEKSKYNTDNSGLGVDRGYIGHKSAKMMKRSKSISNRVQKSIEQKSELLKNTEEAGSLKIHTIAYHSSRLISFDKVSIFYGEKRVCTDTSFTVENGDRIALCGKNGSGKSSLIKLICGEDIEYTGDIIRASGLICSYVSQDTSYLQGSLRELALNSNIDESLFKTILSKLGFSRDQFQKDMSDFSSGQKKKTLIAKSLCEKAHILVWDEPLNFIDIISRIQVEELLISFKPTILFVEHDSSFCEKIASKRVSLG